MNKPVNNLQLRQYEIAQEFGFAQRYVVLDNSRINYLALEKKFEDPSSPFNLFLKHPSLFRNRILQPGQCGIEFSPGRLNSFVNNSSKQYLEVVKNYKLIDRKDDPSAITLLASNLATIEKEINRYPEWLNQLYDRAQYLIQACLSLCLDGIPSDDIIGNWITNQASYRSLRSKRSSEWLAHNLPLEEWKIAHRFTYKVEQYTFMINALNENYDSKQVIWFEFGDLFFRLFYGTEEKYIKTVVKVLNKFFPPRNVDLASEELSDTAGIALSVINEKISGYLDELLHLEISRSVHDLLLHQLLLNETNFSDLPQDYFQKQNLPYDDEGIIASHGRFRIDAKWLRYGRFIVNKNQIFSVTIHNIEKRAEEIAKELIVQFGPSISARV